MNNVDTIMLNFYILGALALISLAILAIILLIIDKKKK